MELGEVNKLILLLLQTSTKTVVSSRNEMIQVCHNKGRMQNVREKNINKNMIKR